MSHVSRLFSTACGVLDEACFYLKGGLVCSGVMPVTRGGECFGRIAVLGWGWQRKWSFLVLLQGWCMYRADNAQTFLPSGTATTVSLSAGHAARDRDRWCVATCTTAVMLHVACTGAPRPRRSAWLENGQRATRPPPAV